MYQTLAYYLKRIKYIEDYIFFQNHNRFQKKLSDRSPVKYRETVAA
ncbi:IS3 family transposase [Effusibacillus dendaii]